MIQIDENSGYENIIDQQAIFPEWNEIKPILTLTLNLEKLKW